MLGMGPRRAGRLTESGIAQARAAKGLTDAQACAAVGGASSLAAGLRAIGLPVIAMPVSTPAPMPLAAVSVRRVGASAGATNLAAPVSAVVAYRPSTELFSVSAGNLVTGGSL